MPISKPLILSCSPRQGGNSDTLAHHFAKGFASYEGTPSPSTETLYLRDYAIKPCVACYACERHPSGACIFDKKDDSTSLFERLLTAPALYNSAYFFLPPPSTPKSLLDRGQSYWLRRLENDPFLTTLPKRPAWLSLIAGRKRGDKLFEGSKASIRFFYTSSILIANARKFSWL